MPTPASSPPRPTLGSIASRWRQLQGSGSWEGLLDPLDPDLRASVIAYGELAEATYDGFNSQRRSPHAGSCIYGHADLLARAGVSRPQRYSVTKFVYATCGLPPPLASPMSVPDAFFVLPLPALREEPWCRESNWMGYVAVATDDGVAALGRRDILVAWRGTIESLEWVNDLDFTPTSAAPVLAPRRRTTGAPSCTTASCRSTRPATRTPSTTRPAPGIRYAGAVFGDACLKGLNGVPDIVECSFVQSTVTELPFFASKVRLGRNGVEEVIGLGELSAFEKEGLESLKGELMSSIEKGIKFALEN